MMKSASKKFCIFSVGCFALLSQALLFREYLNSFGSGDIAVGIFFASWFFWIAFSAKIYTLLRRPLEKIAGKYELLSLVFIPAFAVQFLIILNIRDLAGVNHYETFPLLKLLFWTILANSPISFATGILFPLACIWENDEGQPVSNVYVIESAGSCAGGALAAILLAFNFKIFSIILLSALLLSCAASFANFAKSGRYRICSIPIVFMALLCLRTDIFLQRNAGLYRWTKLFAAESYTGSFQTAQSEYLHGCINGVFTVMNQGSICESVPQLQGSARIAALTLCQNPDARKILVVGGGISLCQVFLSLPQVENVDCFGTDMEYLEKVTGLLPEKLKIDDRRFRTVTKDIRQFLKTGNRQYDMVVIDIPDPSSSYLNRYFTVEFYRLVRDSLAGGGIAAIRFQSGENIITAEQAFIGASIEFTLRKIFPSIVLVPGDESWFIASNSDGLSDNVEILSRRISGMEVLPEIFPAEAISSVYQPSRANFALDAFRCAGIPEKLLLNTDLHPLAFLTGLLLSLRMSGISFMEQSVKLASASPLLFVFPPLVFFILWSIYRLTSTGLGRNSFFEPSFSVLIAGFVSMAAVIVLMFMFQSLSGSLYIAVGFLSSIFMAGLVVGGIYSKRYLRPVRSAYALSGIFTAVCSLHIISMALIPYLSKSYDGYLFSAILFGVQGIFCGFYFPFASSVNEMNGLSSGPSGSLLENADNIGAAAGAFACNLIFLPFMGMTGTFTILSLILLVNIPLIVLHLNSRKFGFSRKKISDSGRLEIFRQDRVAPDVSAPTCEICRFDSGKTKELINEGRLSDREAMFYEAKQGSNKESEFLRTNSP